MQWTQSGHPSYKAFSRWTRTCWKSGRVSHKAAPVQSRLSAAIPSWEAPEPRQFLFCQNHRGRGNSYFCSFVFTRPSLPCIGQCDPAHPTQPRSQAWGSMGRAQPGLFLGTSPTLGCKARPGEPERKIKQTGPGLGLLLRKY